MKKSKSGEYRIQPGRIYSTSNPELSADNPKSQPRSSLGGSQVSRIDERNQIVESPIRGPDALKEGDRIVAPTLAGEVQAVVSRDEAGDLCWVSGGFVGDLEYSQTSRSWVTSIAINKKLLSR
jgi:hypothetical protein